MAMWVSRLAYQARHRVNGVAPSFFIRSLSTASGSSSVEHERVPRICVSGSGIAGSVVCGMLAEEFGHKVKVDVFERSPEYSDQGYGLDLDEYGQEALVRCGVYSKYWDISRPHSDSMCFQHMDGKPLLTVFRPRFLQKWIPSWFGARPETNRGALREVILDRVTEKYPGVVNFRYDTEITRVEPAVHSSNQDVPGSCNEGTVEPEYGCAAKVYGKDDKLLGEYDLVVDSMGLYSSLRHNRVIDSDKDGNIIDHPGGKAKLHFKGEMFVHGTIDDPKWGEEGDKFLGRHGSIGVGSKGLFMLFQRYGAGANDPRTAFFFMVKTEDDDPESLFREIGIPVAKSRREGRITRSSPHYETLMKYMKDYTSDYHPIFHEMMDNIDALTIRPNYFHAENVRIRTSSDPGTVACLPLICLGDSLRNCGLGGGGILAMRDVIEFANEVQKPEMFHPETGQVNLKLLRGLEENMLERKKEFYIERTTNKLVSARPKPGEDRTLRVSELMPDEWPVYKRKIVAFFLSGILKLSNVWYKFDAATGPGVGSYIYSPVYPRVKKALEERALRKSDQ